MERATSNYCLEHDCGECCVRGWSVFVTEEEIAWWKESRPEILKGITSGVFNNERRKVLKKKKALSPDGEVQETCIFYDYQEKCLIHEVKPEMCKKFSCIYHPFFFLRFLHQLSHLDVDKIEG
ncbi:MAG: YkgJ family cysteine cluster protein [Candidatus Helarchaeota archaeon]|nr:YkgJ family cysteine cluster protein [Candidatus Helarchaeota archaeon]